MAKPIFDTLRQLQGGALLDKASDMLADIVRAVEETGKSGKFALTIDLKKVGATVSLIAKLSDKTPEAPPEAYYFYATVEGNLTVDNPHQRKLDLRMAEVLPVLARSIDQETGEIRSA